MRNKNQYANIPNARRGQWKEIALDIFLGLLFTLTTLNCVLYFIHVLNL